MNTLARRATVLTFVLTAVLPAMGRRQVASNEPFSSFQFIDKQLSVVNTAVAELNGGHLDANTKARAARDISVALSRIERASRTLTARYRARRERFGQRVFTSLNKRAALVGRSLTAATNARNPITAKPALDQLSRTTLELVSEYQRVSSNYGAVHCKPREWACCEPKKEVENKDVRANGCKWACVTNGRKCGGFLGPQTLR